MRRLALFAVGFVSAAAWFVYILGDSRALWIAGIFLLLSAGCIYWGIYRCGAVFLGLAAGLLWSYGYSHVWLAPLRSICGTEQTVTVRVTEQSRSSGYGASVQGKLTLEGRTYGVILYGGERLFEAEIGDTVICSAEIEESPLSDVGEDLFYRGDGVVLQLYGNGEPEIVKGTPPWYSALRLWLQGRLKERYDEETAPLLTALITGDQRGMGYRLRNEFSVVGLSHAVAVSGLHVSVLLTAISLFCGYNPRLMALLGIPFSVVFVLMTGASPSACRAAVMQTMMLTAPMLRRENDPPTNLAGAALLLLLQNPWCIADVGFQLSFAAVGGLLVFSSPLQQKLLGEREHPSWFRRFVVSGVTACLSATVSTLPLTVLYFGAVSICAVLTNLLALWAMNLMLVLGLLSCLFGPLGHLVWILCRYVLWITGTMASFPYGAVSLQNLPLMIWGVCAYGAAVLFLLRKKRAGIWPAFLMTAAFLGCILWGRWDMSRNGPIFRVLDVGQGQCILLEADGFTAVIDCGGSYPDSAGEQAVRTLNAAGQTHVDAVCVTHYDKDHAGGVVQLLYRVKVGVVFLPDTPDRSGLREAIEAAALETGAQVVAVSTLTEVTFSDGALTIYPPVSGENDNDSGICILATAAGCDMLITGDLTDLTEMRLLSHYSLPEVEILAAGHHGAENATGRLLLETVRPQLVVISVGKDNYYGHPSEETLQRILDAGAEVRRTDRDGTIVIRGR